ncbi:MAG: hypothetical protein M1829_003920 [Trizodia sp. TS-e1964]|nr:MAG: hypothetical protein M1829_003920 [Trizodia sp. TS-e1964]
MSKRDKRRLNLADRLTEVNTSFVHNSEFHYRQQLQALQIDMSLITRADAYAEHPLADSSSDIIELVGSAMSSSHGAAAAAAGGVNAGGQKRTEGDLSPMSGFWLSKFMDEVNNAIEQRDTQLTQLENRHEHTLHGLHMVSRYKIRLAQEEHKALSQSLKDRLIHAIVLRKARLLKEKEALDISDRNALLLNANQYSILNPSSPGGGALNNRKTRNTRHRPAEVEEMGSGIDAGHKRKRKIAVLEENDIGSPGPSGDISTTATAAAAGHASPHRSQNAKNSAVQFEAPIYSIERLFSDKELSMQMAIANQGTIQYFDAIEARKLIQEREKKEKRDKQQAMSKRKRDARTRVPRGDWTPNTPAVSNNNNINNSELIATEEPTPSGNNSSNNNINNINNNNSALDAAIAADAEASLPLTAPDLDRLANPSHHATRNSTRNGMATALNVLGDIAASENVLNIPLILPTAAGKEKIHGLGPASLKEDEMYEEFNRIRSLINEGAGAFDKKVVDDLCAPLTMSAYQDDLLPIGGKGNSTAVEVLMGRATSPDTMETESGSVEAEVPDVAVVEDDDEPGEGEEAEEEEVEENDDEGEERAATDMAASSGTKRSASGAGFAPNREEASKRARGGL